MATDKELADACVRVGIVTNPSDKVYCVYERQPEIEGNYTAFAIVTDWRVAGALMKRGQAIFIEKLNEAKWAVRSDKPYGEGKSRLWYDNESLPRAIIEACLRAMGEIE